MAPQNNHLTWAVQLMVVFSKLSNILFICSSIDFICSSIDFICSSIDSDIKTDILLSISYNRHKSYRISSVIRQSFFPFQNNPKDLDPSFKTDLDLWDCLGRVKLVL